MTATCEIKWIDAQGNPTPDSNPSIGRVRCKERFVSINGRSVLVSESKWFHICAEHAKTLNEPGMHIWECEADLVA